MDSIFAQVNVPREVSKMQLGGQEKQYIPDNYVNNVLENTEPT